MRPFPAWTLRSVVWLALGSLWLLDGALSLQPHMGIHTLDVVVMGGSGEPAWVVNLNDGVVNFIYARHLIGAFGATLAAVQVAAGALLLVGRGRAWGRSALFATLPLALVIWVVGEWLGGLLTAVAGGFTLLGGAPGAVVLYAAVAALLLEGEERWQDRAFLARIRRSLGRAWLAGALLQAAPTLWTAGGLSGVFEQARVLSPVSPATDAIGLVARWAGHAPVAANALFVAMPLVIGAGLVSDRGGRAVYALAFISLAFMWWFGQDFGGLLSGAATDPNSAPLWALLLFVAWHGHGRNERARRRGRRAAVPARSGVARAPCDPGLGSRGGPCPAAPERRRIRWI